MDPSLRQKLFLELLDTHHAAFMRYVRALTPDAEDARDIVGETLLRAYESFDRLRDHSSFLFYLITIAKRLHWRMAKRKALHLPFERKHEDLQVVSEAASELPPDVETLYRALDELPARQREALVLFELSELSLKEIRSVQGGTLSGVKTRIARARKQLVVLLGAHPQVEAQSSRSGITVRIGHETE